MCFRTFWKKKFWYPPPPSSDSRCSKQNKTTLQHLSVGQSLFGHRSDNISRYPPPPQTADAPSKIKPCCSICQLASRSLDTEATTSPVGTCGRLSLAFRGFLYALQLDERVSPDNFRGIFYALPTTCDWLSLAFRGFLYALQLGLRKFIEQPMWSVKERVCLSLCPYVLLWSSFPYCNNSILKQQIVGYLQGFQMVQVFLGYSKKNLYFWGI